MQALTVPAERPAGIAESRGIGAKESFPEKFLEAVFLDLKRVRIVNRLRGMDGGYQLRCSPSEISLGEVFRRIDGPLAPFEDADSLRQRIQDDPKNRRLFRVLLDVRNAVSGILDHTSLSDLCCRSHN